MKIRMGDDIDIDVYGRVSKYVYYRESHLLDTVTEKWVPFFSVVVSEHRLPEYEVEVYYGWRTLNQSVLTKEAFEYAAPSCVVRALNMITDLRTALSKNGCVVV